MNPTKNRNLLNATYQPHVSLYRCVQGIYYFISVCPEGTFGERCAQQCECVNGICEPGNGTCVCETGWEGFRCDIGTF